MTVMFQVNHHAEVDCVVHDSATDSFPNHRNKHKKPQMNIVQLFISSEGNCEITYSDAHKSPLSIEAQPNSNIVVSFHRPQRRLTHSTNELSFTMLLLICYL